MQIQSAVGPGVHDEGEVQVAQIVVHRAAAGQPPDHPDAVRPDEVGVDLLGRVLVLAHHDGVVVLPEHETVVPGAQHVKHVLFQRQVPAGVCLGAFQIIHRRSLA